MVTNSKEKKNIKGMSINREVGNQMLRVLKFQKYLFVLNTQFEAFSIFYKFFKESFNSFK